MTFPSTLHVGGIEPDVGHRKISQGTSQQLLDIGIEAFGLCCSPGPSRACLVPILSAILWTFLVLVPIAYISATAAMSALSILW